MGNRNDPDNKNRNEPKYIKLDGIGSAVFSGFDMLE